MNALKNIAVWINKNQRWVVWFFSVFYAVGIAGILYAGTFGLFVKLIPLALLLSSVAVAFFHENQRFSNIVVFTLIFMVAFFVEVAGVKSGAIFGRYVYGASLGPKLFETPLIIGLNWVLLVYLSASVFEKLRIHIILKIIGASLIMLGYDFLVEPLAPLLDMWHWTSSKVPAQNYFSWLILALLFHSALKIFKTDNRNAIAPFILGFQLLFFLILNIALN